MSKLLDSKTNSVLLVLALMALIVVFVAKAFFQEDLFKDFFDLVKYVIGGSTVRGVANDGVPKAMEAFRGTGNSAPPSAPFNNRQGSI